MAVIARWTIYDRESGSEHITLSWARRGHGLDPLKAHTGPAIEVVDNVQFQSAATALKLIAASTGTTAQHAIDVGIARGALEVLGIESPTKRGQ